MLMTRSILTAVISLFALGAYGAPEVRTIRVPDGGIQPQAAADAKVNTQPHTAMAIGAALNSP